MSKREKKERHAGFSIWTYDEPFIRETVAERVKEYEGFAEYVVSEGLVTKRGDITRKGWDVLGDDISTIERNVLAWMRKVFLSAVEHGHDEGGHLVGDVAFDANDIDQAWFIHEGKTERIPFEYMSMSPGSSVGSSTIFKGVSAFGMWVLDGAANFYDMDDETWDAVEDTVDRWEKEQRRKRKRSAK